jgi:miniconductance mechanosensitive channel
MSEAGGRRIKRALNVDMNSVGFLDEDDIERLGSWELLRDYIAERREAVESFNRNREVPEGVIPHRRRLTNLGTFRAYVLAYLRARPDVHQDMTLLVRQLAPTAAGLPIEIYVFTSDTAWAVYEGIQADIMDHLLSVLPEFGLRVFQEPTGADVRALGGGGSEAPPTSSEDGREAEDAEGDGLWVG